ncbi:RsmB/NOP family class I SAM-dependent RNA methyltransferase [Roseobacter ponti]|uniref:RsmB/NOP family class I SAM-dependent RNA methyltransferase n=1 Tax=Roseobacter ponti TaxID=1891787 RepID=A0A858SUA5_9RHOB|nr:RsmB/NOP family class I SAM-dependent RNA methyltransferase [Roseobacter ponti]QJF51273.1 RsmB/NOP family class I SAM-dependent RNA methyltransferase [Roseobacter ponti]
MTPGARVAAAIGILDAIGEGQAAEQALTRWARGSRYAGSKDRAAVRDHVFDVLRRRRSAAAMGAGADGRALMIGSLRLQNLPPDDFFTVEGHAPAPLSDQERSVPAVPDDDGTRWNLPDWLLPEFRRSLGEGADAAGSLLGTRAPVTLRVNTGRIAREDAVTRLAAEGMINAPNPVAETALDVTEGARRIRNSASFTEGLVELQDAASQAVAAGLPEGARVLDYCAGGGGKALAIAADPARAVFAHDIDPRRMKDLGQRAARAGVHITELATADLGAAAPFDVVFCDAPCSGSGAWRRSPDGRWTLTPERLEELAEIQQQILDAAASLVAPAGVLAYATCSVLRVENEDAVEAFLSRNPGWTCIHSERINLSQHSDGFFAAHLTRLQE